MGIKRVLASY